MTLLPAQSRKGRRWLQLVGLMSVAIAAGPGGSVRAEPTCVIAAPRSPSLVRGTAWMGTVLSVETADGDNPHKVIDFRVAEVYPTTSLEQFRPDVPLAVGARFPMWTAIGANLCAGVEYRSWANRFRVGHRYMVSTAGFTGQWPADPVNTAAWEVHADRAIPLDLYSPVTVRVRLPAWLTGADTLNLVLAAIGAPDGWRRSSLRLDRGRESDRHRPVEPDDRFPGCGTHDPPARHRASSVGSHSDMGLIQRQRSGGSAMVSAKPLNVRRPLVVGLVVGMIGLSLAMPVARGPGNEPASTATALDPDAAAGPLKLKAGATLEERFAWYPASSFDGDVWFQPLPPGTMPVTVEWPFVGRGERPQVTPRRGDGAVKPIAVTAGLDLTGNGPGTPSVPELIDVALADPAFRAWVGEDPIRDTRHGVSVIGWPGPTYEHNMVLRDLPDPPTTGILTLELEHKPLDRGIISIDPWTGEVLRVQFL